jgi:hypothetical protein
MKPLSLGMAALLVFLSGVAARTPHRETKAGPGFGQLYDSPRLTGRGHMVVVPPEAAAFTSLPHSLPHGEEASFRCGLEFDWPLRAPGGATKREGVALQFVYPKQKALFPFRPD